MLTSIQSVIAAGEQFREPASISSAFITSTMMLVILTLSVVVFGRKWTETKRTFVLSGLMIMVFLFIGYHVYAQIAYSKDLAEWEKNVVEPYLEESGGIVKTITSFEKDPKAISDATRITKQDTYAVRYTNEEGITEVRYVRNDADTLPRLYFDVAAGDEPYIEFYDVPEQLGHGIEKGPYSYTVHLPKNERRE